MVYPVDFAASHRRHWRDAERLYVNGRWGNADQLYGFSAECGMKAVMAGLGMPLSQSGMPPKRYQEHIQRLWPLYCSFVNGRPEARYLGMLPSVSPFVDWSHHNRYAGDAHFTDGTTKPHRSGAHSVVRMVRAAQQDGVL